MRGTVGFRTTLPVPVLLGTLVSGRDRPAAPTTATGRCRRDASIRRRKTPISQKPVDNRVTALAPARLLRPLTHP